MARTRQGKTYTWTLSNAPIGSGDAGEVYAVTCVEQPELFGVLKTPARVATAGTIQRQAAQIAQERQALEQLAGLPDGKAHPPRLLDESPSYARGTANYFIVSETAPGEDLASMLVKARQIGKPFPRRVIITVVDALFDLFARAHRAGILWNDVKLDHIYWHNPTGAVSVIDWGNAIFLEGQSEVGSPGLPRWEDYRQMVVTLGDFLKRNAPELFDDLGWEDFQDEKLDLQKVSVLARRVAYQQQVVGIKQMEFQSLIRVVLDNDPDLTGLKKIKHFKENLEQIGSSWSAQEVLIYARTLVNASLAQENANAGVQAAAIVWELFDDNLDLPWHLIREYFRHSDLLRNSNIAELVKSTFSEDYLTALWILVVIASKQQETVWWNHLIPVLRQKALGVPIATPVEAAGAILNWVAETDPTIQSRLKNIIDEWRNKGVDLSKNPLEYELLEVIKEINNLPQKLRTTLKKTIAPGEDAIRSLLKAWTSQDWEAMTTAFRMLIAWDPDRWGILALNENFANLQQWLEHLYEGPLEQHSTRIFVSRVLSEIQPIERFLGKAPWLRRLIIMLQNLIKGAPTSDYQDEIRAWCPWLLPFTNLLDIDQIEISMNEQASEPVLIQFVDRLKKWVDPDAGLTTVKAKTPTCYPFCQSLLSGFKNLLAFNFDANHRALNCHNPPHKALTEPCNVLHTLNEWRKMVNNKQISDALVFLENQPFQDWDIFCYAKDETAHWQTDALPYLDAILTSPNPPDSSTKGEETGLLKNVITELSVFQQAWDSIYINGIHRQNLTDIEQSIQQSHKLFFTWRHSLERTDNRLRSVFYHSHQQEIRRISNKLLIINQHIRQAIMHFTMIEGKTLLPLQRQMIEMESLLDHLAALEEILLPEEERKFPGWQIELETIISAKSADERHNLILTLSNNHPLSSWLVQSFFENRDN